MILGAISGVALRAQQAGFGNQGVKTEITAFYGGVIDEQAGCQYTADYGVRFTERSSNLSGRQARFVAGYFTCSETIRAG